MAHYTMLSGKRTDTITSRCPICLKIKHHTEEDRNKPALSNLQVCCSWSHYDMYTERVQQFWHEITTWYRAREGSELVVEDTEQFDDIIALYFAEAHMQQQPQSS